MDRQTIPSTLQEQETIENHEFGFDSDGKTSRQMNKLCTKPCALSLSKAGCFMDGDGKGRNVRDHGSLATTSATTGDSSLSCTSGHEMVYQTASFLFESAG